MTKRALLVIDVQNEFLTGSLPVAYPPDSFENILKAIDGANMMKIPVVIFQHSSTQENSDLFARGTPEWEICPEVLEREHFCLIEKSLPGSFKGTGLESCLRKNEIDTVVISGYMTQLCCDTTAREAYHAGFTVEFLSDATGTMDTANTAGRASGEELHRAILVTQAMRFSRVISTSLWLDEINLQRVTK